MLENKSNHSRIYGQREIYGIDEYSVIHKFFRVVIISENIVKFKFNEVWIPKLNKYKENVSGFIKTIIKYQAYFFRKEQDAKGLAELTYTRNADGLSAVDRMEMTMEKLDEGSVIIAQAAVEFEVRRLMEEYGFDISDDEVNYYLKNFHIQPLHQELILSAFASQIGSFRNTAETSRVDLIKLALILKKRILRQCGFEDTKTFTPDVFLPYILTGNIVERVNTRLIKNSNFREACTTSYIIHDLITNQYKYLEEIDPDKILSILSMINNTEFTYCCYEKPDMLGTPIPLERFSVTDELGFYLRTLSQ